MSGKKLPHGNSSFRAAIFLCRFNREIFLATPFFQPETAGILPFFVINNEKYENCMEKCSAFLAKLLTKL